MTDISSLIESFRLQARFCGALGSPFSARLLDLVAEDLEASGIFASFITPWADADPKQLIDDVVPLRMLGALHYLVLSGRAPDLALLYPPSSREDDLGAALVAAARENATIVNAYMASPPQTNEVRRSLCLVGGFLTSAALFPLPLRCLELGASAGLNMSWDRYGYRFGSGKTWGDPGSPVQLEGEWMGDTPPLVQIEVASCAACDQNPLDVNDPDQALRLQSYIWPDQADRLMRLRAAITLKRASGGRMDKADAAVWTETNLAPEEGLLTVIYHSVFIQYPPEDTRRRIIAAIEAAGTKATRTAPLAWLRMELNPEEPLGPMEVRLTLWPTGEERRIALVHSHGAVVRWLGWDATHAA